MSTKTYTFSESIVQIATPYSLGTGIALPEEGLIVTTEALVDSNKNVVITSKTIPIAKVKVLYTDTRYDLAFLELPDIPSLPIVELGDTPLHSGIPVIAGGLYTTGKIHLIQSQIVNPAVPMQDIDFIEITEELDSGMAGGGLFSSSGKLIGINTLFQRSQENHGFALSAEYLRKALDAYRPHKGQIATYCYSCSAVVTEKEVVDMNCSRCNEPIILPSDAPEYEPPIGVAQTIERLITKLEYDVPLTRRGLNNWAIQRGSATIHLAYYEPEGYITADAFLCELPTQNADKIYEFLLKQNSAIKGLSFSVKDADVVLSLVIYDGNFNDETATKLIDYLLERADHYDNILVENYGALWKD